MNRAEKKKAIEAATSALATAALAALSEGSYSPEQALSDDLRAKHSEDDADEIFSAASYRVRTAIANLSNPTSMGRKS